MRYRLVAPRQVVDERARDAAQLHLRAGHRLVGVGALQQRLLADEVAAAGQPDDAPVAALGGALEADQARANGVDRGACRAPVVDRGIGLEGLARDVGVDPVEPGIVQSTEQRRTPDLAGGAGLGLRMPIALAVDRDQVHALRSDVRVQVPGLAAGLTIGQPRRAHSLMPPFT